MDININYGWLYSVHNWRIKMKITIENTEIELTEAQVAEIAKQYSEKPKQVELGGGEWFIEEGGSVLNFNSVHKSRNFGTEFKTEELAKKASIDMRRTNRLRNLAYQLDPDYIDKGAGSEAWRIALVGSEYTVNWNISFRALGTIYMSEQTAKKICQLLNDKLFDLDGK